MEITTNSPTASDGQSRKRKGRNSDIRKEQNRIASRAYRTSSCASRHNRGRGRGQSVAQLTCLLGEKRKQKLALLDEILKSDSHNDSMSSVSDETEYNPTTPAPDFVGVEIGGSRQSSHSPAPFYLSSAPMMGPVASVEAVGVQSLPSNGPSRDTGAYVGYPVNGYSQETDEYAHDPIITPVGLSPGYVSPHSSVTPMPSTPMFPFEEEFPGEFPSSIYPLPDGGVPSFSATSGYDSNMINALQSFSRLNDSQQEEILAFLQKRRALMQPVVAGHSHGYGFGYGGAHGPIPRSSPVPGMEQYAPITSCYPSGPWDDLKQPFQTRLLTY